MTAISAANACLFIRLKMMNDVLSPRTALFLAVFLFGPAVLAQPLSDVESRIAASVEWSQNEGIALLERSVNINSGTNNLEGVREVGRVFADAFESIGLTTRWVPLPDEVERAGHLIAETTGDAGKRILLIGHLDTVFEPDSPFQPFVRDGDRATGQGVADMKGGNVVIYLALKALREVGALENAQITVVFTGDEEKPGKPVDVSRAALVEAGQRSDVALGFEGGAHGYAVVARRGSSGWALKTTGKQAHSSGIFSEGTGAGAIFEAARILDAFYTELKGEAFLTFNPGVIAGGTDVEYDNETGRASVFGKTNVVARSVVVDGGLRFISEEQKEAARAAMSRIVNRGSRPVTSASITFTDSYPALFPTEGNYALLEKYNKVSTDLGYEVIEPFDPGARGAADISFVSFIDALGGLGVYGGRAHTPDEIVDLSSIPIAAKRAAVLIYRLLQEPRSH